MPAATQNATCPPGNATRSSAATAENTAFPDEVGGLDVSPVTKKGGGERLRHPARLSRVLSLGVRTDSTKRVLSYRARL